jgi:hypothetical protein
MRGCSYVVNSKTEKLEKENNNLRQLVIQLSKIIIRNVVDERGVLDSRSKEATRRLLIAITPDEIAPLLREVSLHCVHASREALDDRVAQELEGLSVELADAAQNLQTVSLAPRQKG